ncbi:hypothetical protein [Caulobacter segnis]|nr:hypothetical protein [Caulobacter segnis]
MIVSSHPIQRHGRELGNIFELLGSDENAMTSAFGWCLARAPAFLDAVARRLGGGVPGPTATILLQEREPGLGITDVEIRAPGRVAWIFEAKAGFNLPSEAQLMLYAARLAAKDPQAERKLVVLARADRRELILRARAPRSVAGVPVQVFSWGEVIACAREALSKEGAEGRRLLRDLIEYLGKILGMQIASSNEVYVVALNRETFGGGQTTFLDVVEKYGRYFHPVGDGWPLNPPNYLGFRYDGRLQSVHHVDGYEVITTFTDHFPGITEGEIRPHFLYTLGPPIRPSSDVRAGPSVLRAARVRAHIDLLLTCATITDAVKLSKERASN